MTKYSLDYIRALSIEGRSSLASAISAEQENTSLNDVMIRNIIRNIADARNMHTTPINDKFFLYIINKLVAIHPNIYAIDFIDGLASCVQLNTYDGSKVLLLLTERQTNWIFSVYNNQATIEEVTSEITQETDNEGLTEEELNYPIIQELCLPCNSETSTIDETTTRFSGALWYEEIQKKVVILAGIGGIGSWTALLLSRIHPKSLFIYDDDCVELVNMAGQLYALSDIGLYKTAAIAKTVQEFSDYNSVFTINEKFDESSEPTDIMICGFDNMQARKVFFKSWVKYVNSKSLEDRKHCLFIDGRLAAEYLQVYCFTGDDTDAIQTYSTHALFVDSEADATTCSYKQTTYMANIIAGIIVNLFTNFVANDLTNAPIRELPYLTTYEGSNMQLKI